MGVDSIRRELQAPERARRRLVAVEEHRLQLRVERLLDCQRAAGGEARQVGVDEVRVAAVEQDEEPVEFGGDGVRRSSEPVSVRLMPGGMKLAPAADAGRRRRVVGRRALEHQLVVGGDGARRVEGVAIDHVRGHLGVQLHRGALPHHEERARQLALGEERAADGGGEDALSRVDADAELQRAPGTRATRAGPGARSALARSPPVGAGLRSAYASRAAARMAPAPPSTVRVHAA